MRNQPFQPDPPIGLHGVIGDRRTAALVAADGTLDWLCLPDYDRPSIFGALLDAERGGFWRVGPVAATPGTQRYIPETALLVTSWETDAVHLELTDAMTEPEDERPPERAGCRTVLRRLRCLEGEAECVLTVRPRRDFDASAEASFVPGGLSLRVGDVVLGLWASTPLTMVHGGAEARVRLQAGEAIWAVLSFGESPEAWSLGRAEDELDGAAHYWRQWMGRLTYTGPRADWIRRSALTIHLLTYAPAGSVVAAPTTSLPERVGGDRNYDYRYSWVRDVSTALAKMSLLGETRTAQRFMDWLVGLGSATDSPLQIAYGIRGEIEVAESERTDLTGYRSSLPVRFGNRAAVQRQHDSLGFFVDCVLIYLQQGGDWRDEYWDLVRDAAEFTAASWQEPESGIWELPQVQHFVSGKVMAWVALDRAVTIAKQVGETAAVERWRATMDAIHADVMERGWSDRLGAFRQSYDLDTLDASTLLISVFDFLPADHPRVVATIERIEEQLTIDGFVHRFVAGETPGHEDLPVGEFEGAFLPCTFWLAVAYVKAGRLEEAEAILDRAEAIAGPLGLFAEEVDVRTGTFLGNTPLVFSQVTYVKAVLEVAKARPLTHAQLLIGQRADRVERLLGLKVERTE